MKPARDAAWLAMPDGQRLRLHDWPLPQARGGVLIVHGLGEHAGRYDRLAHWLNAQGYAVRSYDQRGHGESPGPRGVLSHPDDLLADLAVVHADYARTLGSAPLLYEELVPFDCEVSIIGARSRRGEIAIYPLNGNMHAEGILRLTRAPYGPAGWQRLAAGYLRRVLEKFRYTGILTIEFFVRSGRLIANEMAPRVHNSGHWTIEGAETSQFENHLRAILDLPLGSTRPRGYSAMINLIGHMPARAELLAEGGLHLHDYGKQPRPGRKLGHCTLVAPTATRRDRQARRLLSALAPRVRIP